MKLISNGSSTSCDEKVKLVNIYKGKPVSWCRVLFLVSSNLLINQHILNVYTSLSVAAVSTLFHVDPDISFGGSLM